MKICFILPSLSRKGPNIVAKDIINHLSINPEINKIEIYYFNECDNEEKIKFEVKCNKIGFFDEIDYSEYDIIHSHMLKPDMYVCYHKLFGKIKIPKKTKTVTTLHQLDYDNLKYDYNNKFKAIIYSIIWRIILSFHSQIVCLSPSMMKFYKRRLFNKKITFIPNGRASFNKKNNYKTNIELEKKIVIGTSCGLTYRKGLDQVIRALEDFENIQFIIAGKGKEEDSLKFLASKLGLDDRVKFIGFVDEIPKFLKTLDIFVLPSRAEGFPLALIEAMSVGLPCITSDIEVIKENFKDTEVAQFKLEDVNDLKKVIISVVNNYDSYAENAYCSYMQKYTSAIMTERYIKLYKEIKNEK